MTKQYIYIYIHITIYIMRMIICNKYHLNFMQGYIIIYHTYYIYYVNMCQGHIVLVRITNIL